METKYSTTIRALLEGKMDEEAFKTWLMSQPLLDQAAIFREIKATVEAKVPSALLKETEIATLEESINAYEDKILDIKLERQLEIAEIEYIAKLNADPEANYEAILERIHYCILNNKPGIEFMKDIARKIIANEKKYNRYDPENWKDIIDLI